MHYSVLIERKTTIPCSAPFLFDWLTDLNVFVRLLPIWDHEEVIEVEGSLRKVGSRIVTRSHHTFLTKKKVWVVCDVQEESELTLKNNKSVQTLLISPIDEEQCTLEERISCFFPERAGSAVGRWLKWKHQTLLSDLSLLKAYPSPHMRILVSGSSGLIGRSLVLFLRQADFDVVRLVRSKEKMGKDAIFWDPERGKFDREEFENFDAIVHLAGRNIAAHRWTDVEKKLLFQSRCRDTWLLSQLLSRLKHPPKVVVVASGVGFYGNREKEVVTEKSSKGSGFLSDLALKCEQATAPLKQRGIRVVNTRFGSIVSTAGGLLGRMVTPFKWCLGGKFGAGSQSLSWVDIDDAIHAIYFSLVNERLIGPINVTSPYPTAQEKFARLLGKHLHRKTPCNVPASVLRKLFGEMADELFLTSLVALPKRLEEEGFVFSFPTLEQSLEHFL